MQAPKAPDPYATAAAQTQSNKETANYQQSLNMVNQITPYGSIHYDQTGTSPATGAPTYTATTTLDPRVSHLVDSNIANNQAQSDIQGRLAANASDNLSHPLDLSNDAVSGYLNKLNRSTMDPQWADLQDQTEQKLYNRGLTPGGAAYDQGMRDFYNARNNAYNSAYLANHQQGVSDLMAQYNAPLNAMSALKSGSQISQPGVGQTAQAPQTGVQGTNIAGLIQQNYQQQLQNSNATMGGLFGLGGTALNAAMMFL